jgi:hypothetical protein
MICASLGSIRPPEAFVAAAHLPQPSRYRLRYLSL